MAQCKARLSDGSRRCKLPAMRGKEVCHKHGGKGGAPKGNKNALVTGEYETINPYSLTDEEKAVFDRLTTDPVEVLDEQIKVTTIRAHRMMKRIKQVMDGPEMQKTAEMAFGPTYEASLERMMAIEDALTRVQRELRNLVAEKRKLTGGVGDEEGVLEDLSAAITEARQRREAGDQDSASD